jgi:hypothetical protein
MLQYARFVVQHSTVLCSTQCIDPRMTLVSNTVQKLTHLWKILNYMLVVGVESFRNQYLILTAFYRTRRFVTAVTRTSGIQFSSSHTQYKIYFNIILPSTTVVPHIVSTFWFSAWNLGCVYPFHACYIPTNFIFLDLITITTTTTTTTTTIEVCQLWNSSHWAVFCGLQLLPNILLRALFSKTLNWYSLTIRETKFPYHTKQQVVSLPSTRAGR